MSLLRNVLTYMGLGPDEDYDDGYLSAPRERPPVPAFDDPAPSPDEPARPEPDAPERERAGRVTDPGPSRAPADVRAELRPRGGAGRPLRAVPPESLAGSGSAPAAAPPAAPPDLVQPESGITVRAVTAEAEAGMGDDRRASTTRATTQRPAVPRELSPQSFGEAKILADEFKAAVPVVMNLQGIERDLARRLIDFASGICYALDGSMEKLAPQVFLLTPRSVEVSEEDRHRIEQGRYDR
jgi:cell division inhibitor SepF